MPGNQTGQGTARFRNDDGNETGASWIGAENANVSVTIGNVFRLRFRVYEIFGTQTRAYKLQYNRNSAGWNDVNGSSSVAQSVASSFVTNNTATSRQLSATGNFTNGVVDTSDGATASVTLTAGSAFSDTEEEFCLKLVSPTVAGDIVEFRVVASTGTLLDLYPTSQPHVTAQSLGGISAIWASSLDNIVFAGTAQVKIQATWSFTLDDIVFAGTTSSGVHAVWTLTLDDIVMSGHVGVTPPGTHWIELTLE